jgi:thiol-disulfide isomerase/thioredoxin
MVDGILVRAGLAAAIIAAGIGLYWLAKRLLITRIRGERLGLENFRNGIPGILYFTTPECMPCKTFQRPELEKLNGYMGKALQIIEVDATLRPDLASFWGVLSVPTMFIIDSKGRPRRVNIGATSADKLYLQICEVESKASMASLSEKGVVQ